MAYFRQRGEKWSFTIDIGTDSITGKRKQKTVSGFDSERDARKAADKMEDDIKRGKRFDSIVFKDFLTHFMEKQVKPNVAESTYFNQLNIVNAYIVPYLGKRKVDKITDDHIEAFFEKLQEDGVSRGLIRNIGMVLGKALKHAQKKRLIVDNPMKLVTTPTYKAPKMKVWNQEEVNRFLELSKGDSDLYAFYVLALATGARRGELLALTWNDISFDRGTITITKSLIYTKESKRHITDTKTENSQRTIRIPQYALDVLKEHQQGQMKDVKIVFDNFGEYHYPGDVSRKFKFDLRRYNMPELRLHDLRHTHATLLLQRGFNAKVVAERLGDSVEMVMKTYAHVLPNMQDEVAAALDQML